MNSTLSKQLCRRRIKIAFLVLCLMPFLGGCANLDPILTTKVVFQPIPESLLLPCTKSELEGDTYQAAIQLAINRGKDLEECSKRFDDIRDFTKPE